MHEWVPDGFLVSRAGLVNACLQEELMSFMRAVNPCVDWTETQWRLIVDEACPLSFHVATCCTATQLLIG